MCDDSACACAKTVTDISDTLLVTVLRGGALIGVYPLKGVCPRQQNEAYRKG